MPGSASTMIALCGDVGGKASSLQLDGSSEALDAGLTCLARDAV